MHNLKLKFSERPLFQERPYTVLCLDQLQGINTSDKKLRLKQLSQTFLAVCAFQGTIRAQVLLDFFLSHSSPVHISKSPFQRPISTLSSHLGPRLSSDLFASGLPTKALHTLFAFSMPHFSSIHSLFEEYKSCSSSLCKFVYYRLTATSLELNNLLRTLFPYSRS